MRLSDLLGRTRLRANRSKVVVPSLDSSNVIAHEIMLFMKLRPEHGVNNNVASLPTLKERKCNLPPYGPPLLGQISFS